MKKVSHILLFIAFAFIVSACSTCKVVQQSPIQEIQFGSGGGFSGIVTTYTLRKDGSIWEQKKKIAKLSCDSLDAIFELAEQIPQHNYIRPDNMYSFIRIITKNQTFYYTWSWPNMPDKKVTELFSKLNTQL